MSDIKDKIVFVTGTDTSVGKTFATSVLLAQASAQGRSTVGLKPVASGCYRTPDGLRNIDAELLRKTMSTPLEYAQVNPIAFEQPIAPHILMAEQNVEIDPKEYAHQCLESLPNTVDQIFVEGAGGWRVPLCREWMFSDLAVAFTKKVIMVVGMRLGCINHALLTAEAIERDGAELIGWVANCVDLDMQYLQENLDTLDRLLPAPRVLSLPYIQSSMDRPNCVVTIEAELQSEYERVLNALRSISN